MAEPTTEKKPKKRARRNFAKELERVEIYLATVIRVYEKSPEPSEFRAGQLDAFRDVLDFIQQGGAK